MHRCCPVLVLMLLGSIAATAAEGPVTVRDDDALRAALKAAQPGAHIRIAPGRYRAGVWVEKLRGTAEKAIVIEGSDPQAPPAFEGGAEGWHLSDCAHVTLRNIAVAKQTGNGINVDDGGTFDSPSHHITLENLRVSDTGPNGNHDAIKLSGVDDFIVRDCTIEGWGGQAVDMVGCHRGLIEGCTFRGKPGFSQHTGPQTKGGSSEVVIRRCRFFNAGSRAVHLGGSTGLAYFRPKGTLYEAKDITVEGCTFIGSEAPVAFVGVEGAVVRYNTIYHPAKWVMRILQETTEKGFAACGNGRFERNLVVFRRADVQVHVNVGANTRPETFRFADNLWFCDDQPKASKPSLPAAETGAVYGVDPQWEAPAQGRLRPTNTAAAGFGAEALPGEPRSAARFSWFSKAPPLVPAAQKPAAQGEVIRVATAEQLLAAAARAKPGGTILLADGRYALPRRVELNADGLTLRGASGRREAVVLDGGPHQLGELVSVGGCSGVTIADLTVENVRWNGLKINSDQGATRVTIYNCVVHNVWQRGVKGPAVPAARREHGRPADCRIQYCFFYNDRPKQFADDPADRPDDFNGNYIGGIDAMYAKGWTISDNLFVGLRGRTGEGRGAIFLWHDAQDCLIERNAIVDCDSGICLGNSYRPAETPVHCTRCTVRNNFLARCPENGILADYTRDCRILHNTIHDPGSRLGRLIRLVHDNDGLWAAGNLLSGPPIRLETQSPMKLENNLATVATALFRDAAQGDLHLQAALPKGGAAPRLNEAAEDFDRRPRQQTTTVGAAEAPSSPSPPVASAAAERPAADRPAAKAERREGDDWVEPMRKVHAAFRGKPGTLAQYGDSITTTMAFLAPHAWGAKIEPKNCPAEVRADLDLVARRANRRLWTEWKGPKWGNEGSTKSDWLAAHVDEWQKKMQPEAAIVLFGTNDIGQIPSRRYAENLETALRRMMADGTVPLLTTPPPKSGAEAQAREYRDAAAAVAQRLSVPLIDFHGEILRRRPDDWDGRLEKFGRPKDVYSVATLISADGVHPSNPAEYLNDFGAEALARNGYNLRNYLTLRAYAQVIRRVFAPAEEK